jgi:hypothetical protein
VAVFLVVTVVNQAEGDSSSPLAFAPTTAVGHTRLFPFEDFATLPGTPTDRLSDRGLVVACFQSMNQIQYSLDHWLAAER